MTASVALRNVTKRFGDLVALNGVSFSVEAGETVALLGPSGCGKTTILRQIAGFDLPDAGEVVIGGRVMGGLRPYERNVGLVFQHYALFPHMTVAENVAYGLRHRGHPSRAIPGRVAEMLDLVRLTGFADRRPDQLSGGQQQRVALARALATRPSLVLLDEPLSALDAKLRQELRSELKQVLAAVGSTAIVVTHDQEEAMSLGERVFVMRSGVVMQIGTPNAVYWRPNSRFVADFMGRTNWLAGRIDRQANQTQFRLAASGWTVAVDAPDAVVGPADLCVRPESVEVMQGANGGNVAAGRVLEIIPLGVVRHVLIELAPGERLLAAQPNRPDDVPNVGDAVRIRLPPQACLVFPPTA
jgi:putative spermidine/putrescine transport system ATP-binding protein/putrescine transport system ATP-binding protein